jgi:hypothetical protein
MPAFLPESTADLRNAGVSSGRSSPFVSWRWASLVESLLSTGPLGNKRRTLSISFLPETENAKTPTGKYETSNDKNHYKHLLLLYVMSGKQGFIRRR